MDFLNFLREDPVMAWLVFLGLLLAVVPVAAVLWRKMSGRNPVDKAAGANKQTGPFWQSDGTGFGIYRNFVAAGHRRLDGQYSPSIADLHRYAGEQT